MKKSFTSLLVVGLVVLPAISVANDFSTVGRVRYVQDCIKLNEGSMNIYEATHKCSCVLDKLAEVFTEKDFEDANTGFQLKNMPGERGAMFREDAKVQRGISLFEKTHIDAYKSCRIRR